MNKEPQNLEEMLARYGRAVIVVDDESEGIKVMGMAGAHSVDIDGKPKKGVKKPIGDGFKPEEDDEEEYDSHGIELGDTERKVVNYLSSIDDDQFDTSFPENKDDESAEELKVFFDVGFSFLRRAITNRRGKRKRKKDDVYGIETKVFPCWQGYVQVGMKKGKRGKMVPNCVPENQAKSFSYDEIQEKSARKKLRDPKGGLTAAGRAYFKRKEGANLKPGVKGAANTPEKMRRKGSFLTRFFTNPSGPMKDDKGRPTRLALSAAAWGEPVPGDAAAAARLAEKGRNLLKRYENTKKKNK
jgi:hypothetical protein